MSKAMQLLGSKISLISKSEIRYEGILFTLNPNESTLALAKVRMFGTENRPTENPVAARDEVFEFIIFRGQDIKDIRLCEPPAPQTPLPGSLPYDPAIVQHSVPALGHLSGSGMPQTSGLPGTMLRPSFGPLGGLNPYSSLVGGDASAPGGPLGPLGSLVGPGLGAGLGGITGGLGLSGAAAVAAASESPLSPQGELPPHPDQISETSGPGDQDLLSGVGVRSTNSTPVAGTSGVGGAAQARKSPSADQSAQQSGAQKEENRTSSRGSAGQGRSQNDQRTGYNARGGNTANRGVRGGRARGRGAQGGFSRFAANYTRNKLKFDEDYDFESANVKFEELKSKMGELKIGRDTLMVLNGNMNSSTEVKTKESETVKEILTAVEAVATTASEVTPNEESKSTEPVKVCYDKAKSFFDSISCEAVERSKGNMQRTDWRQERKLNAETFGLPFNPRRGGYNRGAGGGGSGRGYYGGNSRGGGGGGYGRQQNNAGNEGYQRDGGHQRGGNSYRGGFRGGRGGGRGQRDGDSGGQQRSGGYRRNNWQQQENRA